MQLNDFLNGPGVLIDVRSPSEFAQGHIPGAFNLPLFSDDERALIGTLFKQQGKDKAVEEGLKLVGPKLFQFTSLAKEKLGKENGKVYCWRGGMRSNSMAWLLNTAGIPSTTLHKGYKTFRQWVLKTLQTPRELKVIGGLTGSGKTAILQELKRRGEQVLNLEQLACHLGSAYGTLDTPQPSNELFENKIAVEWASVNPNRPLWIEDESRLIGRCKIPDPLFHAIRSSPLIYIERPLEQRIKTLQEQYGKINPLQLIQATEKIGKRLGNTRKKGIIHYIETNQLDKAIAEALQYYDRTYHHGLSLRKQLITKIPLANCTVNEAIDRLQDESRQR